MRVEGADFVVVGAGIGGLAAALLLAGMGAQVTVLERFDAPGDVDSGLLLHPNGLAVLVALGLGDALDGAGVTFQTAAIHDERGGTIAELRPHDGRHRWDRLVGLRSSHLHRILSAAIDQPLIGVRLGAQVTAAHPDGSIELRWRGRTSTIAADLVVGADGVGSTVRAGGAFGTTTRETGARFIHGLVEGADLGLDGEHWTRLGLIGGAAVDDATTYVYAAGTAPQIAAALATQDADGLWAAWSAELPVAARALSRLLDVDGLRVHEVLRVDCRRMVDGRLVLVGDAAHAMAPTLWQGANSAIVDAAVLAIELASSVSVPDAVAGYSARRLPAVRRVQDLADRLVVMAAVRPRWLRAVRNGTVRSIVTRSGPTAALRRLVMQEDPAALHAAVTGCQTSNPRSP
jgi:2-polyprenyl-6-methoxyphenol hydroxylase-like FAD-dependent oxidoreductase